MNIIIYVKRTLVIEGTMCDDDVYTLQGAPAYNVSAWNGGNADGPQCSASGEFCYFCAHQDSEQDTEFGAEDDCLALRNMVRSLARQKKEFPHIITTVYNLYEKHIRGDVEFTHPVTGIKLSHPKWTKSSIQRHLMFSNEFPELFDDLVNQVFHSIIQRQQEHVMARDTSDVIEDRRKALMDTVKTYTAWRTAQHKIRGAPKKPKA